MRPKIASLPPDPRWLGGAPGRDLTRFGLSIAIAAAFSTAQAFLIPRQLDLVTFGQYRMFLVYVGFLEVLNFGLADGAFLRWAGRPPSAIGREWRTVGRWLLAIQLAVACAALLGAAVVASPLHRLYLIAFSAAAMFVNAQVLSSYALQASGDFKAAGRIAVLAPGLFVISVISLQMHTLAAVLTAYVSTLAITALYAARCVASATPAHDDAVVIAERSTLDAPRIAALIHTGAPVLGASIAAILARSADKILVSIATPITSFARYGFASTVMVTANVAIHALSRVALSHAARRTREERARFLGGFFDIIAAGYGLGLIAEPLFEHLVARYLSLYVDALPILRALLFGLPLTIATQVVLVGTLQSYDLARRQFAVQLYGVALGLAACGTALAMHAPLWAVATAATFASAATFATGVAIVNRAVPEARAQACLRFTIIVALQSAALLVALQSSGAWTRQTATYTLLALVPTWFAARQVREHGW